MNPAAESRTSGIRRFRTKLLVAMMLVVAALTSLGLYLAQWSAAKDAQRHFQRDFDAELESLDRLQKSRTAAVAERCRTLARHPRIHAALEDNAIDLLYPSAKEELRDLMERARNPATPAEALQAKFYRFLDGLGTVLPPPTSDSAELQERFWGLLRPNEQAQLAQPAVPQSVQTGYLVRQDNRVIDEMRAVPIRSSESGEVIAALVLGTKPVEGNAHSSSVGMQSGIWVNRELRLPAVERSAEARLAGEVSQAIAQSSNGEGKLETTVAGTPHSLFFKRLNPNSNYPPAYEICLYPRTELIERQRELRWQILAAGGALLFGGFIVSNIVSRRLSQPVEKLAVVSEENFTQRQRAEAALQTTAEELQRSARFSADASHQLKSPITVLRAGLDSLLTREGFPQEVYEEVSTLIHQTYRLTGVVEDLLLLSRMDAGKLRLTLKTVDLAHLVAEWLDDLRALPDAADLRVETDIPDDLQIAGEIKYTALVVQNLLDNARKYNRPGGTIRIFARRAGNQVELRVANTGRGIPVDAHPYVFERFHRAGASEDVPGHGLGLNLARELVRLHGGELRLVRSDGEWTEFSAVFRAAVPAAQPTRIAS